MKKIGTYLFIVLISVIVFLLGFDYKIGKQPNTYYQVYLDSELMGIIESKEELEIYINNQANTIRENVKAYKSKLDAIDTFNKYESNVTSQNYTLDKINDLISNWHSYNLTEMDVENLELYKDEKLYELKSSDIEEMRDYISSNEIYLHVDEVSTPNGIEIKKIYTYNDNILSVEEIYKNIILKKSCTISGYKFTIKYEDEEEKEDLEIYTLDTKTFSDAIEGLITIFVNESEYENYKKNKQPEITTTGSIIENVYVNEQITYKAVSIPVEEKIYTNSKELSAYLLYDNDFEERNVKVKVGDSIESLAFDNEISVQEFLISNTQYTSRDNLLVPGTDVTISRIMPKVHIVETKYEVVDKETEFSTIEQYDENLNQGSIIVTQQGENGLERVAQDVKIVNGEINFVEPVGKETLKSSVPKIISIGTKYVPNVGSITSWGWPTDSGYTLSSYYGYRQYIFGSSWHSGLDIAGTGYGSNIYAANNGVIETRQWSDSYGWYIIINHNNGYYTLYGHMSRFSDNFSVGSTVSRGDVIGYVGSTGDSTGPHLHYEIRTCQYFHCTTNPLNYYR